MQPIYEEEGPRRAPKSLLSGEEQQASSKTGGRKISQPSIKLDVIDESGGMLINYSFFSSLIIDI